MNEHDFDRITGRVIELLIPVVAVGCLIVAARLLMEAL